METYAWVMPVIRVEEPGDAEQVRAIHIGAFESADESQLVDALRSGGWSAAGISLVAKLGDAIVGHVLITPAAIERDDGTTVTALGLGPLAVAPAHQRSGIGSALMDAVLARARTRPEPGVFLLGHSSYYPRFGFVRASLFEIRYPSDVPSAAWMAWERLPGSLSSIGPGVFRFAPPFEAI